MMSFIIKCGMKLLICYPFPNFNCCTVRFGEWTNNFILNLLGHVITYPCWDLGWFMSINWSQAGATGSSHRIWNIACTSLTVVERYFLTCVSVLLHFQICFMIKSLWPRDSIWGHETWSSLTQVMAIIAKVIIKILTQIHGLAQDW